MHVGIKEFTEPWLPDVLRDMADWIEKDESNAVITVSIHEDSELENYIGTIYYVYP